MFIELFCVWSFKTESYAYYGTNLDNKDNLNYQTKQHTSEIAVKAAQFAGQMALRLVHDHLLNLDVNRLGNLLTKAVAKVYNHISQLSRVNLILTLGTSLFSVVFNYSRQKGGWIHSTCAHLMCF